MGHENVRKDTVCVKLKPMKIFGQQTPRRWGWGTPLKKRTATRTELLYGTTDDFVNWLLTSQQKRSGKFREQVAEHHHRGSRDGALMACCAVRRRVRRRRIRFGTSFLLYSFSPRNAGCDGAARHQRAIPTKTGVVSRPAMTCPKTQRAAAMLWRCQRSCRCLRCLRSGIVSIYCMPEYKVKFDVFEGPLDLLLYLIKKEEVDIYEVNLTRLATQFIEYIETMRLLDLEIAGEFLVMAATLMYIKSRELLPVDQQVEVEGEEDGEDPRWELIRQLVEYKKFKDAAAQLADLEARQESVFPRAPVKLEFEAEPQSGKEASIFDLLNAVNSVLQRLSKRPDQRDIFEDKWSVSEKIEHLMRALSERSQLRFSELFADATSRSEVVVTFLALLELIRLKQLLAVQSEAFGEIEIRRAPPVAESASVSAAEAAPADAPSQSASS